MYINSNILNRDQLTFGKSTYLVYMQDPKGEKSRFSLWEREIKKTNNTIEFNWVSSFEKSSSTWKVHSILDQKSFLPIEESAFYSKDLMRTSNDVKKQFTFSEKGMISSPDTSKHNFKPTDISYPYKPFDWQLDMETFSQLPLGKNRSFLIYFYHPGGPAPAFHEYTVVGEETLTLYGEKADYWILKTNYNEENYGKWWIDKKTFKVVKLEEKYNKMYRFKVLIAQDLM